MEVSHLIFRNAMASRVNMKGRGLSVSLLVDVLVSGVIGQMREKIRVASARHDNVS